MGDRALIQFKSTGNFQGSGPTLSPAAYLHWSGSDVARLLQLTAERMAERGADVNYAFARFVGICHEGIDGCLSLGVWNQTSELTADDSHGDAGCFVVTLDDAGMLVECLGGYGFGHELAQGVVFEEGRYRFAWGKSDA